MNDGCTQEAVAGWVVEIQLFCRTCGTAKCLRLNTRAWRVRTTSPEGVSELGGCVRISDRSAHLILLQLFYKLD